MSDLIDREAALKCFHAWVDKYGDVYTPDDTPEYQAIEALPSVQPEQQWIPCSERLPEYGEAVLTINEDEDYEVNHIIDEDNGEWFYDGAIAWMPLPEPYMEDNK